MSIIYTQHIGYLIMSVSIKDLVCIDNMTSLTNRVLLILNEI